MMTKGLIVDENLSILTCASDEISVSSGTRNEADPALYSQLSSASTNQPPPSSKRKRNLPGNPDPEAEVMALSPKTLMATNRFLCEICNKGFQRDQNLQLHRRGHNLPWKLKQRSSKEVKKKVYVCPEVTCVHHHPSRALGDLTGIKKHFSRKHGEKKWKCEKCSKRYAVQSDWKAHSKICGTREYRCDCGTLFSRRDSFITHRAFCDALAHESSTAVTSSAMAAATNPLLHSLRPFPVPVKREQDHHLFSLSSSQVPSWLAPQTPSLPESVSCNNNIPPINPSFSTVTAIDSGQPLIIQNHQQNPNPTSAASPMPLLTTLQPQNDATGLVSCSTSIPLTFASYSGWELASSRMETGLSNNNSFNGDHVLAPNLDQNKAASTGKTPSDQTPETPPPPPPPSAALFHHMMTFEEASFEEALNGILLNRMNKDNESGGDGELGETRDFLGLRALGSTDHIFNNDINDMNSSSTYGLGSVHHNHTQTTFWRD